MTDNAIFRSSDKFIIRTAEKSEPHFLLWNWTIGAAVPFGSGLNSSGSGFNVTHARMDFDKY
jgi:hypothetical protein